MALFRPSTVVAEVLLGVLLITVDLQVRGNKINMFPSLVNLAPFPCFHLLATPPTSTSAFAFYRWDRRASLLDSTTAIRDPPDLAYVEVVLGSLLGESRAGLRSSVVVPTCSVVERANFLLSPLPPFPLEVVLSRLGSPLSGFCSSEFSMVILMASSPWRSHRRRTLRSIPASASTFTINRCQAATLHRAVCLPQILHHRFSSTSPSDSGDGDLLHDGDRSKLILGMPVKLLPDVVFNHIKPSLVEALPHLWLQASAMPLQPIAGDLLSGGFPGSVSSRDLVVIGFFLKGLVVRMLL